MHVYYILYIAFRQNIRAAQMFYAAFRQHYSFYLFFWFSSLVLDLCALWYILTYVDRLHTKSLTCHTALQTELVCQIRELFLCNRLPKMFEPPKCFMQPLGSTFLSFFYFS